MKKRLLIFVFIFLIIGISVFLWHYFTKEDTTSFSEYTPQEEISEEQARQSLVTLYFLSKENNTLMPEARLIDAKLLATNPYFTLVSLLINVPKNEKLKTTIPTGTKLNNVVLEKDMAIVDLSEEFIKDIKLGAEEESKIVYSIVNTLVELTEIESVKILINGKENMEFADGAIKFDQPFVKID